MIVLNPLEDFLLESEIIDYGDSSVLSTAKKLNNDPDDEIALARRIFHFVRDNIDHSFDIQAHDVTKSASEVLLNGHGICYAKSHLLAALFRANGIPAGLCYQKLIFEDGKDKMSLHSLNAIYLKSLDRWIRLDARGNKPGVDAQFDLGKEKLAFEVRKNLGEIDYPQVYSEPLDSIVNSLNVSASCEELLENLPVDMS